jgi:L-threonylcarbamoyladenylate synthase
MSSTESPAGRPPQDLPGLDRAVELLRAGGLVAFPTETVYGLGADATNPAAVARIFAAKGRPADHPLIVHLASVAQVAEWADEVPASARALARAFWPGPLTLVLHRSTRVPDCVTGGQDTVGLRVPSHPVAHELLQRFGGGVAAPSANRHGRVSPTRAEHVREELGERVDLVLDGGDCEVGLESTIVGCSDGEVTLLRPGHITRSDLEQVVGPVRLPSSRVPRVPGSLRSHYAPATPVELVTRKAIGSLARGEDAAGIAVLAPRPKPSGAAVLAWRELPADPRGYGRGLYAALRELDALGAGRILVERVPPGDAWAAVADRLERAARRDPPEAT